MNKPKSIRPFKTLDEEAKFWETHDLTKLMINPKTSLDNLPLLESEKEEVMTLRVQKSVKNKIKHIARHKGINPSTLARMWIIEKLHQY